MCPKQFIIYSFTFIIVSDSWPSTARLQTPDSRLAWPLTTYKPFALHVSQTWQLSFFAVCHLQNRRHIVCHRTDPKNSKTKTKSRKTIYLRSCSLPRLGFEPGSTVKQASDMQMCHHRPISGLVNKNLARKHQEQKMFALHFYLDEQSILRHLTFYFQPFFLEQNKTSLRQVSRTGVGFEVSICVLAP